MTLSCVKLTHKTGQYTHKMEINNKSKIITIAERCQCLPWSLSFKRQRQVDLCEFQTIVIYKAFLNSYMARAWRGGRLVGGVVVMVNICVSKYIN